MPAAAINDEGRTGKVGTRAQTFADGFDLAAVNQQVGVLQFALRSAGPNRRPFHQDGRRLGQRPATFQGRTGEPLLLKLSQLLPLVPFFGFLLRDCLLFPGFDLARIVFLRRFGSARFRGIHAAINPDFARFVFRIEITVARNHREVGDFAGLDRAKPIFDTT